MAQKEGSFIEKAGSAALNLVSGGSNSEAIAGLKAGELLVHVFIEETRGLRNPKHADATVDAIIEVKAFGKTRYSKVNKDVGSGATFWGDHYFFEKSFGTTFELENERIQINVSDHKLLGVDARLGTVELNIPTVYYKDKHVIHHQWAALSGFTQNFQEVLGFVKFSVGVFAAGDEQITLGEEKPVDSALGKTTLNILYPPQIITQSYQIQVRVIRGAQLKKMDTFGKCDPYVQVLYGGLKTQTTILKVTQDPTWNEDLYLPISLPTVNDRIIVRLWDWDSGVQSDELMGSAFFSIKDIMDKKYKNPFWVNIYGCHTGANAPYDAMQNEVSKLGTEWHGRIQIAISMREEPKPVLTMQPLRDANIAKLADTLKRDTFELRFELHYAMNLRKDGEDITIRVKWGAYELATKKRSAKNRVIEFYESLSLPAEFTYNVSAEEEVPDVFIYISNADKNLSFIRKPWTEFAKIDAVAKDVYFKVDRAKTTTRDDLAGIVKMRAFIFKKTDNPKLNLYGWDRPVQKRQGKTGWKIHCNIYQAKDLVAGDSSGLSDPYLNFYFFGDERRTSVINETLNPVWNEKLEFNAYFDEPEDAPPLILTMWDWDSDSSSDFIGSSIISLSNAVFNPQEVPKPKWIDVKYGKDNGTIGKVLLSIICYSRTELIPRSPYIEPDSVRYYINLKILGLRQLESIGILPVKRAFVKFDVDSLRNRSEKSFLPEKKFVKTEPLNPGSDPNILTVINLDLNLPTDPDFCPAMTGTVSDYIFKGLSQPLIGTFSIPLGTIIKQTSTEIERRIEKLVSMFQKHQEAEKLKTERALKKQATQQLSTLSALNIEGGSPSIEQDDYKDSSNLIESETKDKNPLLGRFTDNFVDHFAKIKETKGLLPGENENVKIDIYGDGYKLFAAIEEELEHDDPEAGESGKYIKIAKYSKEGEEINKPDETKYMGLGHHNKFGTSKKHYRYFIDKELEKSDLIDPSPFLEIPIYRGKRVDSQSFFASLFGKSECNHRCVGYFKSMITIMSEFEKMRYDAKLKHVGTFAQTQGLEFSDDEFLRQRDVLVRVYIIEAEGLPDKDDDSNSDPFLVVKLGKTVYNEKKFWQENNPNPKFNKCFEFPASLPGASKLTVELYDYDKFDADDLIGSTKIDIEDRWYSSKWRNLKYIPIETRPLYHPSSSLMQGKVKLWVEIIPRDGLKPPLWDLAPKPPVEYEMRVVVWECKDVPNVDIEDATDIYITGKLADGQTQRTDTHIRSQNGQGNFNWRMVFPVQFPMRRNTLTLTIWDKDLLSANDYISEATFDFTPEALRAFNKEETIHLTGPAGSKKGDDTKFWIPCSNNKIKDGRAVQDNIGQILVSVSLVPKEQAKLVPVGKGRSDPNQHPYLPPPEGRFQLTWNIAKLWTQLVGPLARRQIYIWGSAILCILIIILCIPMIISGMITRIFT